jgi:uncharacterized membrane protein YdbT with pleckstrin-like domain
MRYLKEQLMSGETVVKEAHLHWIVYFPAMCVVVVAAIAGIWLGSLGPNAKQAAEVMVVVLGAYALYLALGGLVKRRSARFAITNKRVLIDFGLIRRRSSEILLSQIEGITVHQGFWGRAFNYGTLVIEGTGGDGEPFRRISAPDAFRRTVQEQIELQSNRSATDTPSVENREAPTPPDRYGELLKLDELRKRGILSEREFEKEKGRLFGKS